MQERELEANERWPVGTYNIRQTESSRAKVRGKGEHFVPISQLPLGLRIIAFHLRFPARRLNPDIRTQLEKHRSVVTTPCGGCRFQLPIEMKIRRYKMLILRGRQPSFTKISGNCCRQHKGSFKFLEGKNGIHRYLISPFLVCWSIP